MRKTRGQFKKERRRRTVRKQRGGALTDYVAGRPYDPSKTLAEIVGTPALDVEKKPGLDLLTLKISTGLFDGAMTPQEFSKTIGLIESQITTPTDDNVKELINQYKQLLDVENEYRGDSKLESLSNTDNYPLYLWYLLVPLQETVDVGGQEVALTSLPVPPAIAEAMARSTEPVAPAEPAPSDISTRTSDLPPTSTTNAS